MPMRLQSPLFLYIPSLLFKSSRSTLRLNRDFRSCTCYTHFLSNTTYPSPPHYYLSVSIQTATSTITNPPTTKTVKPSNLCLIDHTTDLRHLKHRTPRPR
ncbi:uncharacterized protein CC84DRAFT_878756 [Paraphaeosphaeria sporulosa]|uniref:Uncharacterized protein n=1 Tax=Paraphaeosphaeria sporulosa TaxID=1460663 RepID=A0A177CA30_9PLEO|nr:uncharacterized protein CC84DRAFT_878756 [Paraphaeosphaeria sporulosa]OAG03981.1 hypothetical protein CC84DRAFT_878756 [Paraphaeosphaeria sporulosa]